jgi:TPP-dependent trihydroxycyclohexane-1,2-dione (THcHDO) dehydratase
MSWIVTSEITCHPNIALVRPNTQVVSVAGDGGFLFSSQDLETAVRKNLNITTCVLGRTSAAEIAHGNATPSVCIPLLNNKCLGYAKGIN